MVDIPSEFYPIITRGEIVSRATAEATKFESVNTVLNWPAGTGMHKALAIAASRGIEDVKKLLDAVGAEVEALAQNMPLSALTSRLTI